VNVANGGYFSSPIFVHRLPFLPDCAFDSSTCHAMFIVEKTFPKTKTGLGEPKPARKSFKKAKSNYRV
jgi:hypothetical protein